MTRLFLSLLLLLADCVPANECVTDTECGGAYADPAPDPVTTDSLALSR